MSRSYRSQKTITKARSVKAYKRFRTDRLTTYDFDLQV